MGKHSRLLQKIVTYGHKKFYNIGPWTGRSSTRAAGSSWPRPHKGPGPRPWCAGRESSCRLVSPPVEKGSFPVKMSSWKTWLPVKANCVWRKLQGINEIFLPIKRAWKPFFLFLSLIRALKPFFSFTHKGIKTFFSFTIKSMKTFFLAKWKIQKLFSDKNEHKKSHIAFFFK